MNCEILKKGAIDKARSKLRLYNAFAKLDVDELFVEYLNVKGTTEHSLAGEIGMCETYRKVLLVTQIVRALE